MPMPPPVVRGGSLHSGSEALEEVVKEAQREFGTCLTVGCRRESQSRQMGQMAAGGVAVQDGFPEESEKFCTLAPPAWLSQRP